jgi:hypothetical protein
LGGSWLLLVEALFALLDLVVIVGNIVNMNFGVVTVLAALLIALSRGMEVVHGLLLRGHGFHRGSLLAYLRSRSVLLSGDGTPRAGHEGAVGVRHAGCGRHLHLTVELGLWLEVRLN